MVSKNFYSKKNIVPVMVFTENSMNLCFGSFVFIRSRIQVWKIRWAGRAWDGRPWSCSAAKNPWYKVCR